MSSYLIRINDFGLRRKVKTEHVLVHLNRSIDDTFLDIHRKCRENKIRLSVQLEFKNENMHNGFLKRVYPTGVHVYSEDSAHRLLFKNSKPNIIIENPCGPKFDSPRTRRYYTMIGYGTKGHYQSWISDRVNALALERWHKQCISTILFSASYYEKHAVPVKEIIKNMPEDSWYLLVLGTYHPHDNFHTVIDAFITYMNTCLNKPGGIGMCVFLGKYESQNPVHVDYKDRILRHVTDMAYEDHFIFLNKMRSRITRSLVSQSACIVYLRQNVLNINKDIIEFMRAGTQALLIRFGPEVDFIQEKSCGALVSKPTVLRVTRAIEKAMHPIFYCEHCINARSYYLRHMTQFQIHLNQIRNAEHSEADNIPFRSDIRAARSRPTIRPETQTEDLQVRYNNKPLEFEFDESDDEVNCYFRVIETPTDGYSSFRFKSDCNVPPTSSGSVSDIDCEIDLQNLSIIADEF